MSPYPVNALVVGDAPTCLNHDRTNVVYLHGGRGYEPRVVCLECYEQAAQGWLDTNCPYCVSVGERVIRTIEEYRKTGVAVTADAVPDEELPEHRPGCMWASPAR